MRCLHEDVAVGTLAVGEVGIGAGRALVELALPVADRALQEFRPPSSCHSSESACSLGISRFSAALHGRGDAQRPMQRGRSCSTRSASATARLQVRQFLPESVGEPHEPAKRQNPGKSLPYSL